MLWISFIKSFNKKQNNMEENQTNKDYLNSSLVFAKALGLVFEEGQGVVVDVTNDIDFGEDVNKVFVFALNGIVKKIYLKEHPFYLTQEKKKNHKKNLKTN